MNTSALDDAISSIIAIANPDIKAINFALVMVKLALMSQMIDIDWQNDYRNALMSIKDTLEKSKEDINANQRF